MRIFALRMTRRLPVAGGTPMGFVAFVGAGVIVWVSLRRVGVPEAVTARPASQPGETVVGAFGVPMDTRPDAHDPAAIDACLQSRRDARVTAANMALSPNVVQKAPFGDGANRREIRRA